MNNRLQLILIIAVALLIPSLVFAAANKVAVATPYSGVGNVVVVPLTISNDVEIAALDIPLRFSEGVTLKEVDFTDTRVEYFDLKAVRIDNENHSVVLGLLPQFSVEQKPDLAIGEGVIARLVFEINDPDLIEISLEPIELELPTHRLTFVTRGGGENGRGIQTLQPEYSGTVVSLSGVGENLPTSFALKQNYPNPFNPATEIAFDLPVSGHVELSVYNVLGQHVSTLVNTEMDAGSHIVTFDGSVYSSGVYFYRISSANFNETKKMVMLK